MTNAIERSAKFATDLIFWRAGGRVEDRGDYLVVETPSNPDYYFGNLLVFGAPPREGDTARWRALFRAELGQKPGIRHETFEWIAEDGDAGDVAPFVEAGFDVARFVTLVATDVVAPPHPNPEVAMRPLESDEDWAAMVENQVACRDDGWPEQAYRDFMRSAVETYRSLVARGRGAWLGGFLGGRLAADLGIFWDSGVARFQNVCTSPDFRRRGLCGTLVHEASRRALDSGAAERLVMVADPDYHAARIYESLGFRAAERSASACLRPPDARGA